VDLLIIFGSDIEGPFPRFFERFIWNQETLFGADTSKRDIVYLGTSPSGNQSTAPDGRKPQVIPCQMEDLPLVAAAFSALAQGLRVQGETVGGIPTATLEGLV